MKKIAITLFVLLSLMISSMQTAVASSDPVSIVQSLADEMIASLKANKTTLKTNPKLVYSLAYRIVIPHADLDEMSQRVLSPQTWNNASASQRTQFKKEFTDLLVHTYASALANYTDQTIRFFPVRGNIAGKNSVVVNSQIVRSDGPSIAVSYRLHLVGSQWELYDMSVEGVSLLQSFQEQFRQKLSQGNMDQLLKDLKQHNMQKSRR
jgi:phospholipid transport system substrate-binding protein